MRSSALSASHAGRSPTPQRSGWFIYGAVVAHENEESTHSDALEKSTG